MPASETRPRMAGVAPPEKVGGKRRKAASGCRARKKQKRLDAICDNPAGASSSAPAAPQPPGDEGGLLRRSSRVRRAPALLDASPVSARRRNKPRHGESPIPAGAGGSRKRRRKGKRRRNGGGRGEGKVQPFRAEEAAFGSSKEEIKVSQEETEDWRSRLRARAGKGRAKASFFGKRKLLQASDRDFRKEKESSELEAEVERGMLDPRASGSSRRRGRKTASSGKVSHGAEEIKDQDAVLQSNYQDGSEKALPVEEDKEISAPQVGFEEPEITGETGGVREETEYTNMDGREKCDQAIEEEAVIPNHQLDNAGSGNLAATQAGEHLNDNAVESEDTVKEVNVKLPVSDDTVAQQHLKEARRCSLCGGGIDGRPPKRLVQEATESDNEAYEGSSASEEPNYDVWDGFGDEPGWLGRLLGPIHDRFGIARVWVHQHCAVWSPEVYFAGLGCLRNVRAALCRGRALKCSRCGRPGATIGCRVDRCPKTYHLPCSRAEGCIFDHRKFLIACNDHRHLFQPQGEEYHQQIRKMKAKKLKLDMRKLSHDVWRQDLEAEEKWLENCGEDEEFLKREGKRLHRDLLKIAPVYIGGSLENEKLYQGWESVAGLQDVIRCMKEVVILPLLYPELFSSLGLTPPRGVLLHGYPGTGKTLVVRALIGACSRGDKRIAYFARKGADCLGKYVGDAERHLRLLFQVAERSQPSIIFFDEIDGLAPCRSRHQDQTHNSVVSTLLSLLDGLKSRGSVIVIGATNRPDAVDPALRRPGRFDREIYFPLPTQKDRAAILSLHTQTWPNPVYGSLLSWIANQTAGYAGADLQSLCTQAAMNALKRNCPLQEFLSSAEKFPGHGRLPSLPSFIVEERDWLAALAAAPPPCSRREAGMAANEVVTSPLHSHLIPCLLKPLSHFLISFYIDERIWLPPALMKASRSIKNVIISALEKNKVPVPCWLSHFHSLIQEPHVANEIERILSRCGLVTGPSGSIHSYGSDADNDDPEKFNSCRLVPSGVYMHNKSLQKSLKWGNALGFRALIAGTPRSGQQHLASCLLHGFMGHIEIQKVNLATISQEGHGDIIRGLTQILMKCLSVGRCVIFMPRIDLWAIDETVRQEAKQSDTSPRASRSSGAAGVNNATKNASEAWNSFVEQVDSVCASSSIIILATCEMHNHDLPLAIREFFSSDVLNNTDSAAPVRTIPRFVVNIDGDVNLDLVINSCAAKLSQDIIQYYVQLVHQKTHLSNSYGKNEASHTVRVNSEVQRQSREDRQEAPVIDVHVDSERLASNSKASCSDNRPQHDTNGDQEWLLSSKIRGRQELHIQLHSHEDSIQRILSTKVMKGSSIIPITSFGYQILRYPQFSELCWVTSKLKEGPCTDISGPWKGWPFNSCLMDNSDGRVVGGMNSTNSKEHSGIVRGLVAVGLLAYKGAYRSVSEVSSEVRKVLELLVGQIHDKIVSGKDGHRYFRLLAQVAYLEDIVNTWAYAFRSVQTENPNAASNTKPVTVGRRDVHNHSGMPGAPDVSSVGVQEVSPKGSPHKFVTSNGECANTSKECSDFALPNSGGSFIQEAEHPQEPFPSVPAPFSFHPISPLVATTLDGGNSTCRSESPRPSGKLENVEQNNGLDVMKSNIPSNLIAFSDECSKSSSEEANGHCNGTGISLSSNNGGSLPHHHGEITDLIDKNKKNLAAVSKFSCLYSCCSKCLHAVYILAHDIISDRWRASGHCSTVDDIHDFLASCLLNLLATVRKFYVFQGGNNYEELLVGNKQQRIQSEHCACQNISHKQLENVSCQHEASQSIVFLSTECTCHSQDKEDTGATNTENICLLQSALSFFFKDGVLMPSNPKKDAVLHCRFQKFCLCSLLEVIFKIKKPTG